MSADAHTWPWPDSLDAVIAAPKSHRVLLENERVRVLEVRIAPGELVPVHTHRWPSAIYIAKASDFLRRDADGNLLFDSRNVGPAPRSSIGPLRFRLTPSRTSATRKSS